MVTLPEEPAILQLEVLKLAASEAPVTINQECKTLYCPSPPQPDSCLRTFLKEYGNSTNSIVAGEMIALGEGRFLQQSRARGTPYVAVEQTQLTVVDTSGRLLDSRMLVSDRTVVILSMTKLRDSNLLSTGIIHNGDAPYDIYLIKFTPR
jgi:hypothetical protein